LVVLLLQLPPSAMPMSPSLLVMLQMPLLQMPLPKLLQQLVPLSHK
jgi:hypothetical protein